MVLTLVPGELGLTTISLSPLLVPKAMKVSMHCWPFYNLHLPILSQFERSDPLRFWHGDHYLLVNLGEFVVCQ